VIFTIFRYAGLMCCEETEMIIDMKEKSSRLSSTCLITKQ
jgi:hypothetical protein